MPLPVYYVGTPDEVEHHAKPLRGEFDVRIVDAVSVVHHARAGDVCVFYNEFFPRFREAIFQLTRQQCATLYAIDGILEWRNLWEFPLGMSCLWSARPILSHKVACVGRSQARIFESFGHAVECEVVGLPRLDKMRGRTARVRGVGEPFTILILTAKCPGFNAEQLERATQSLKDLKNWLSAHTQIDNVPIRSVWRITQGLEQEVGVDNTLKDTTGDDLAQVLTRVDAIVTTPSTAMLEGMLQRLPVALLDYNNCPHYVPAAWRITAPTHFDQVIPELVDPPIAKMHYQQHLLHDALECQSPALPRLAELIERMHAHAQRELTGGRALTFPPRMLSATAEPPEAIAMPLDYQRLFPGNPVFAENDLRKLQAEVQELRRVQDCWSAHLDRRSARARIGRLRDKVRRKIKGLFPKAIEPADDRRAA
jgi:hypothetical protein